MLKTAMPSSYPKEGIYQYSTIHVDLACVTPGARIYYTINGDEPTIEDAVYIRNSGLLALPAQNESDITYTIRAFANADGLDSSRVETFKYRIICSKRGKYAHQIMREPSTEKTGIIRIEDFDLDKMYLIIGSKRAILMDAGWDDKGDLPNLCKELTGDSVPIDLVIAHGHPDHIAQMQNFIDSGSRVYMPYADAEIAASLCPGLSMDKVCDIRDGDVIDLGNTQIKVYTIPGHTPGGVVLVDENTGDLFSSDQLGSNRRYVPDSAWLQLGSYSIESCLKNLEAFRDKNIGKIKRIFTGHNDEVLDAVAYLESLQRALKKGVDEGECGLSPS